MTKSEHRSEKVLNIATRVKSLAVFSLKTIIIKKKLILSSILTVFLAKIAEKTLKNTFIKINKITNKDIRFSLRHNKQILVAGDVCDAW